MQNKQTSEIATRSRRNGGNPGSCHLGRIWLRRDRPDVRVLQLARRALCDTEPDCNPNATDFRFAYR